MSKKGYILIALILSFLLIASPLLIDYLKLRERRAQRYHLYCEILKPGMTGDDIRKVLGQIGQFVENSTPGDPNDTWRVAFYDANVSEKYGGVSLDFHDYKYDRAYIEGFEQESVDVLCDFGQPTNSVTNTPTLNP